MSLISISAPLRAFRASVPVRHSIPVRGSTPDRGKFLDLNVNVTYQPTNALRTSLDFIKNRLVRNDTGRIAFDDNIFASRTTYQFTRFTFFRARIDYSTFTTNVRGQYLVGSDAESGNIFFRRLQ